jgi:hypothetical protein
VCAYYTICYRVLLQKPSVVWWCLRELSNRAWQSYSRACFSMDYLYERQATTLFCFPPFLDLPPQDHLKVCRSVVLLPSLPGRVEVVRRNATAGCRVMEHGGSKCLVKVKAHCTFSQVVFRVCSHHGLDQVGSLQVIKLLIWLEFVVPNIGITFVC